MTSVPLRLIKGEPVRIKGEETIYAGFDKQTNRYSFRDVLQQTTEPYAFAELMELWDQGQFSFGNRPTQKEQPEIATPLMRMTPEQVAEVRRWLGWIKPVEAAIQKAGRRSRKIIESTLTETALKLDLAPPATSTFYKYRGRYIRHGIAGLIRRAPTGRPPKRDPEVVEIVRKFVANYYLNKAPDKDKDRHTILSVVELIGNEIERLNALRDEANQLTKPDYSYVYRYIKSLNQYDVAAARYGKLYAKQHYGIYGRGDTADIPNQLWIIDHTLLDLVVVDESRSYVIGRPWLTLIVDACTRMIVGFHLSYSPPSYWSVAQALKHAIRPKTYVREKYPDIRNEWSACGRSLGLEPDRGAEFLGEQLEALLLEVGMDMYVARARTPTDKAMVESLFKTLNKQLWHQLHGTTFSHVLKRLEYNSEKQACLTKEDLLEVFHTYLCDYYQIRIHSGLHMSPLDAWTRGMEGGTVDPFVDFTNWDYVFASRFPNKPVHHYGIDHLGIRYSDPALAKIRSRAKKRGRGETCLAEIRENPDDLGFIWVTDPEDHSIHLVPALDFAYANGLSRYQQEKIMEERTRAKKDENLNLTLEDARARIERINAEAFRKRPYRTRKKEARLRGDKIEPEKIQTKPRRNKTSRSTEEPVMVAHDASQRRPRTPAGDHVWEVYND